MRDSEIQIAKCEIPIPAALFFTSSRFRDSSLRRRHFETHRKFAETRYFSRTILHPSFANVKAKAELSPHLFCTLSVFSGRVSKWCVFPLRKRNWRLKINSFARHDDTGLACSLFSFSLGFFSGVKNSNPKEKVSGSSSSAGSLVAICSLTFCLSFSPFLNAKYRSHSRRNFSSRGICLLTSSARTMGI